jgi:hypothetical protein
MGVFDFFATLELSNHNSRVNSESPSKPSNSLLRVQGSNTRNKIVKLPFWNEKLRSKPIRFLL